MAAHAAVLPEAGGAVPPSIHLLPAGTVTGTDGRGPYRLDDPAAVIAATQPLIDQGRLRVDYGHASLLGADGGAGAENAGFIRALEARPDGIWATVDWTDDARRKIAGRAYQAVSPVFEHDPDGRILRLLGAGLTNKPNLPLVALSAEDPAVAAHSLGALTARLAELGDRIAALEHARTEAEVDRLIGDGRALPAERATLVAMATRMPAEFAALQQSRPVLLPLGDSGLGTARAAHGANARRLDPDSVAVCAALGLDPAAFLATATAETGGGL